MTMGKKASEIEEVSEACYCLRDHLDHYFKDASEHDAIRLKLSVINKLEATIRYDRKVKECKK